jgi:hypothetical protein
MVSSPTAQAILQEEDEVDEEGKKKWTAKSRLVSALRDEEAERLKKEEEKRKKKERELDLDPLKASREKVSFFLSSVFFQCFFLPFVVCCSLSIFFLLPQFLSLLLVIILIILFFLLPFLPFSAEPKGGGGRRSDSLCEKYRKIRFHHQ